MYVYPICSGVAAGGSRGQSAPLTKKNLPKIGEKREKIRKNGKQRKNQEGSFTFPSWQIGLAMLLPIWWVPQNHGTCSKMSNFWTFLVQQYCLGFVRKHLLGAWCKMGALKIFDPHKGAWTKSSFPVKI